MRILNEIAKDIIINLDFLCFNLSSMSVIALPRAVLEYSGFVLNFMGLIDGL